MSLQSRVDPFGNLFSASARGTLMGNRGGRIHADDGTLGTRRWASRQWICCVLDFGNRHRKVWSDSYTEMFFLDEVIAFAAGHRPCFECRRKDAEHFAALFSGESKRATALAMDRVLQAERLDGKQKKTHHGKIDGLPDGAMIAVGEEAYAVRGKSLLHWTPKGYDNPKPRPDSIEVDVLTPPSILSVLDAGYAPRWHPSATKAAP
jgi:hypothetical protein